MQTCPYLGMVSDPDTPILYTSEKNACHRNGSIFVSLGYQAEYCLSEKCQACPAFLNAKDIANIPRQEIEPAFQRVGWPVWGALVVAILLLLFLMFDWSMGNFAAVSSVSIPETLPALPTLPATEFPTATQSPELIISPTPRPVSSTATSVTITATPEPTTFAELDTPIGADRKFVIHQVTIGENLEKLATYYGTTSDAIQAVNHTLPIPLWEGWIVIIPLSSSQVDGLPAFEGFEVTDQPVLVEELAAELQVNLQDLLLYNNLLPGQSLPVGWWLLLPHAN